jgi:hypothetical protein
MAKQIDVRVDRTIEFWRNRKALKFLLTAPTINLLDKAVTKLTKRKRFSVDHIQALGLAVSLLESQLRDCLRLAVDDRHSELDHKSEFLDIKIDAAFFSQVRSRRFTLGEFVFINTSISTIDRLWNALTFCFPYQMDVAFEQWLTERGMVCYPIVELKASLAWIYSERNKYTHEFFDDTALRIGSSDALDVFCQHVSRACDFLSFVQQLKWDRFKYEFNEEHHQRGDIAKAINRTAERIEKLVARSYALIDALPAKSEPLFEIHVTALKSSLDRLVSIYEEYVSAVSEFTYSSYGPMGSIRTDLAMGATFRELKSIEKLFKHGYEDMKSYSEYMTNAPAV